MHEKKAEPGRRFVLEAGVGDIESALLAFNAGAGRIELFANMPEGGTTPSVGTLSTVLEKVSIPVMVMIRPRGGDFVYTPDEFQAMCKDVKMARDLQAAGIVIGCLSADGCIDLDKCARLIEVAGAMDITFHRAFDLTPDLSSSLDALINLGIRRVLTAGGKATAWEGIKVIRKLRQQAGNYISIMPGGGVRAYNIYPLARETGCQEFHLAPVVKRESALPLNPTFPNTFYTTTLADIEEISSAVNTLINV